MSLDLKVQFVHARYLWFTNIYTWMRKCILCFSKPCIYLLNLFFILIMWCTPLIFTFAWIQVLILIAGDFWFIVFSKHSFVISPLHFLILGKLLPEHRLHHLVFCDWDSYFSFHSWRRNLLSWSGENVHGELCMHELHCGVECSPEIKDVEWSLTEIFAVGE